MPSQIPPSGAPESSTVPEFREARLPRESRISELELIISGAVLFALVRAPRLVDGWFELTILQMDDAATTGLILLYSIVKIALYVLIGSFVIHLAGRAFWVGLVGLHAAFPGGVRWEELRYGPITREAYREKQPGLEAQIARIDRFCSTIFPLAFAIVLSLTLGVFAFLAVTALVAVVAPGLGGEGYVLRVLLVIVVVLTLPGLVAHYVDRYAGERIRERSPRLAAILRRMIKVYYVVAGYWTVAPVMNVLMSNEGKRRVWTVYNLLIPFMFGVWFLMDILGPRGFLALDGYRYLPEVGREHGFESQHYANLRRPGGPPSTAPVIQSDMVVEPYVRLFIPYIPGRHNLGVAESCPGLEPLRETGLRVGLPGSTAVAEREAALACLARLQRVFVNGEHRQDLRFRFFQDPVTRLRGIVTFIPVVGLPAGENLITVDAAPRTQRDRERDRPLRPPYQIPFWLAGE
jgi:hypothetical protein